MALIDGTLQSGTRIRPRRVADAGNAFAAAGWTAECVQCPQDIRTEWHTLEAHSTLPFMDFAWAEAWYATASAAQGHEIRIVIGRDASGEPAFILPFTQERRGPFSVLVWPGGTHCAYNCGLFSHACRAQVKQQGADAFWSLVFAQLDGIDAIAAYGLPEIADEADNPLYALPAVKASCASYRFDLTTGWPVLYEAKTSTQRRREDRRCERRLAEMGEVRFTVAGTQAERVRLMNALLDQKSVQLRSSGAPDFPGQPGIRAFYNRLMSSRDWCADTRPFIAALEVDGDPVAVNFGLIRGDAFYGLMMSMGEGDYARFAPGRQALKRTIEHHCAHGIKTVDLGVGEESNKIKWADMPVARHDVIAPLTLRGHLFAAGLRLYFAVKTQIKHSPALWRLFSRYRRYLGC